MQLHHTFLRRVSEVCLLLGLMLAGAAIAGLQPEHRSLASTFFVALMLAAIGWGIGVAARLREANDPLAPKAVPSTLAALLLYALMTWRWWLP